ncbi:MAG: phosphoribosylglycinamide formyltransferase [Candidatus Cloacimonetes bacterium]|nr:phosphoribosylglycinamide formyltransferase [Candidatus Cloacimonadota bacterium]
MRKIAILSSGKSRGSNFLAIYDYIKIKSLPISIEYLIVTDKSAPIVKIALDRGIAIKYFEESKKKINDFLLDIITQNPVDLIVLAGFMRKLSSAFFQNIKIVVINVHPALLPKYGGKGMYGMNVHKAVFEAEEKVSGATIHIVDELYDNGFILCQKECDISMCKSPDDIAKIVLRIEHEIYPKTIEKILFSEI